MTTALDAAGLTVDPASATLAWAAAVAAAGVGGLVVGGPAIGVLAPVAVCAAPIAASRFTTGRQVRLADAQLPELLDQVGRSLRGGASLHLALTDAARAVEVPLRQELVQIRGEVEAGAPIVDAFDRWAQRCPRRPVRLVVAALASCAESGGAGARAVDGVAASLRASAAVAGEVRALASQARYSALVIALAPLGFSFLAVGADPRTARFLLATPIGQACLAGGIALDAIGAWWMQRVVAATR
jgi:tight adherence protein B